MSAMDDIAKERLRQIEKEGYTPAHDDEHADGSLAMAAACYAAPHRLYQKEDYTDGTFFKDPWPWEEGSDRRPHEGNVVRGNASQGEAKRRALLVKAGALIAAEIDRIDRATEPQEAKP